jgi:DNA-binding MarR family transcriptional regulator
LNRDRQSARGTPPQPKQDAAGGDASRKKARKPLAELLGEQRVAGLRINLQSMALISNIHRASGLIRQHFERTVLDEAGLHWSAFVTLWCLWIYGELETRRLAIETGVAKSTLSSILNMLEERKLIRRRANEEERRLVIVNLTAAGAELISALFPKFNAEETRIAERLSSKQMTAATEAIRVILATIAELDQLDDETL